MAEENLYAQIGKMAFVDSSVAEAAAEPMARPVGSTFGKFLRVSLLGRGSTGSVWKCVDQELGRCVAVKFLEGAGEATIERFLREAKIAARLEHPNIARVYEAGSWEKEHYIVMQYIAGQSLAERPLPLKLGLETIAKAARALHYAHRQGFVHRDIKPANIMLDEKGETFVLDFGLAKELQTPSSASISGLILGTPTYMSPEQACGEAHHVDARSDVYSLGATLYEVVTRRPPFTGDQVVDIIYRVQRDEPEPPRRVHPDLPREIETIIIKSMEKEPARRYPTAEALAQDIERHLRGEPILAHRSSVWYRLRKKVRRQPAVFASVGVGLLLVLAAAGIAFAAHMHRHAEVQSIQAEEARIESERARLARIQQERDAVDPLIRRLWGIDLTSATSSAAKCGALVVETLEQARALVEQHPDWGGAWLALGWSERLSFRYGQARDQVHAAAKDLDRAVERSSDIFRSDALYQRGMLYADWVREEVGAFSGVTSTTLGEERQTTWKRRSSVLKPELIRRALEDLRNISSAALNEPGKVYGEALLDFLQGKFQDAIDRLERAKPGTLDALLLRAQCYYFGLGDTRACKDVEWIAEATLRRDAMELAALMNFTLCNYPRAREFFDKLIQRHPGIAGYWTYLADIERELGQHPSAIDHYTRAIQLDPQNDSAFNNRGLSRFRIGDVKGAIEDCTRAIDLQPGLAVYLDNRSVYRMSRQDLKGAIEDCTRAIKLEPADTQAFGNRGCAKQKLGDYPGAYQDYSEVLKLNPGQAKAWTTRGMVRLKMGDMDGAIQDHSTAIELSPKLPEARVNRADAFQTLAKRDPTHAEGLWRKALIDLEEALRVAPADWVHRSMVEERREYLNRKLSSLRKDW